MMDCGKAPLAALAVMKLAKERVGEIVTQPEIPNWEEAGVNVWDKTNVRFSS